MVKALERKRSGEVSRALIADLKAGAEVLSPQTSMFASIATDFFLKPHRAGDEAALLNQPMATCGPGLRHHQSSLLVSKL